MLFEKCNPNKLYYVLKQIIFEFIFSNYDSSVRVGMPPSRIYIAHENTIH